MPLFGQVGIGLATNLIERSFQEATEEKERIPKASADGSASVGQDALSGYLAESPERWWLGQRGKRRRRGCHARADRVLGDGSQSP